MKILCPIISSNPSKKKIYLLSQLNLFVPRSPMAIVEQLNRKTIIKYTKISDFVWWCIEQPKSNKFDLSQIFWLKYLLSNNTDFQISFLAFHIKLAIV